MNTNYKTPKWLLIISIIAFTFTLANAYIMFSDFRSTKEDNKKFSLEAPVTHTEELSDEQEYDLEYPNIDTWRTEEVFNEGSKGKITAYHWGFKKRVNDNPQVDTHMTELLKQYNGIYMGDPNQKTMYLTFDLGYENGYTVKILDALKAEDVKAIFYITGHYFNTQKDIIKRIVDEGHKLGNHTVNHPNLAKSSDEKIKKEISELHEAVKSEFGQDMVTFRPPSGIFSEKSLEITRALRYKTLLWSATYDDWDVNKQRGQDYAYQKLTNQFHNGAIFLLHAVSKDNAEAMQKVIQEAKKHGFNFDIVENI